VRIALGASAGTILKMVLANAARVIGAGALIGLMLAALLAQSIAIFLFGVQPLDPLTFAGGHRSGRDRGDCVADSRVPCVTYRSSRGISI